MSITKWATMILVLILAGGFGTGLSLATYHAIPDELSLTPAKPGAIEGSQWVVVKTKEGAGKKTDKERIVGTWRFSKGLVDGEDLPEEFTTLARMTFTKDGNMIMSLIEDGKEGKYDLVGPGKIDLGPGKLDKVVSPAIYKFEGDNRLILCASKDDKKRPTEFIAEKGTGQLIFGLVRAKPGEEKPTPQEIARFKGQVNQVQEAVARTMSVNNLKQLGLAMHNYLDTYKTFPAHAIYSKDGKTPLLSWRVAILPFIDEKALYDEFKLDEPWDSPHNIKLVPKMPKTYEAGTAGQKKEGKTYYQVFTGPDTPFDGAKKIKLQDISDGTSNTVMMIEAKVPVIWSKPADLTMPKEKNKLPAIGGLFKNGFHIVLFDGSVRIMVHEPAPALLRGLVTPAGGEILDLDPKN